MEPSANRPETRLFNRRTLMELALGLMAGIVACVNLKHTGILILGGVLIAGGFVLFLLKRHRLALVVFAAMLGMLITRMALPAYFTDGNARIEGVVTDLSFEDERTVLTLSRATINGEPFNKSILLTINGSTRARIGDAVYSNANIRSLRQRYNTYNEFTARLASGIGCIARATGVTVLSRHNAPLTELVHGIRTGVTETIKDAFEEDAPLFSALLIGVRDELNEERYEAYRASGTAHLLAISGFHVGMVVSAVGMLIPKRSRRLRIVIIGAVCVLYCTVAAYTPGIVRASIMTGCYLLSGSLERRGDQLTSLSLAAILILIFNPFQLYSIGFQLSFSACFGIALFDSSFRRALTKLHIPTGIASAVSVCVSATLGTLMLQLRYFNSFTPYSVIANLVAVPAFSVIVISGIVTLFIAFAYPPAGVLAAIIPRGVLFVVEEFLSFVAKLPFASMQFDSPPMICCIIYFVFLFAVSEYTLRKPGKRLEYGLIIALVFTLAFGFSIIKA